MMMPRRKLRVLSCIYLAAKEKHDGAKESIVALATQFGASIEVTPAEVEEVLALPVLVALGLP